MKINVEQRTKLFNLIRKRVLVNKDKLKVVSSDYPNQSFIYEDDDFFIVAYYNLNGFGVSTHDMLQLSLHDKKTNYYIKFDSGDYMFMKKHQDFYNLIQEIKKEIFESDITDNTKPEDIDKILKDF